MEVVLVYAVTYLDKIEPICMFNNYDTADDYIRKIKESEPLTGWMKNGRYKDIKSAYVDNTIVFKNLEDALKYDNSRHGPTYIAPRARFMRMDTSPEYTRLILACQDTFTEHPVIRIFRGPDAKTNLVFTYFSMPIHETDTEENLLLRKDAIYNAIHDYIKVWIPNLWLADFAQIKESSPKNIQGLDVYVSGGLCEIVLPDDVVVYDSIYPDNENPIGV